MIKHFLYNKKKKIIHLFFTYYFLESEWVPADKSNLSIEYAIILEKIASIYNNFGMKEKALEMYENIKSKQLLKFSLNLNIFLFSLRLEIYEKIFQDEENLSIATNFNNMALIYSELGDLEKAFRMNQKVYRKGEIIKTFVFSQVNFYLSNRLGVYTKLYKTLDNVGIATTLSNISNIFHRCGRLEYALEMIEIVYSKELGKKIFLANYIFLSLDIELKLFKNE